MSYIFLDESGQFNKNNDEQYFIVGAFTVGNAKRTNKLFRSWHRSKFPLKMRFRSEIKFSNTMSEELRIKTLKFISKLDVRIHCVYLKKENIPEEYRKDNSLKSGHLYTHIIGEALSMFLPSTDQEFRVFCDKRHLKGIRQSEFSEILKDRIIPLLPKNSIIQIEMIDSTHDANIQIADWISGALAYYLEKKELGAEYHAILKHNLLGEGKELFKDHWENIKNKKSTD
jgi:hypothetical protein